MNASAAFLAAALLILPLSGRTLGGDLRILTSFLPMYVFTRNVVGDVQGIAVEMMLPASVGCPHDYSLTPGDMRKIAEADVFITNGHGMEDFLGAPVRKANPDIRVVETASSVTPIRAGGPHGGVNPHTWVSPRNSIVQVRAIEQALAEISPGNASAFRRNADAYRKRLERLAGEIDALAARFRNRNIVTFHNAFDYLAVDLGLHVVGRVEETPGQGPSAGEMQALIRTIRTTGAAALFAEPQYPERLAATIAQEAGIPVRVLDPVSTGSTAPTTYEDVMRGNLAILAEALGIQ